MGRGWAFKMNHTGATAPCHLPPYTKLNSWIIKDLDVSDKNIKILKDNIVEHLHDVGAGTDFLNKTQKVLVVFIW